MMGKPLANRAPIRSSERLKRRKAAEDAANLSSSISDAPDSIPSELRFSNPPRSTPDSLRPCHKSLHHRPEKRERTHQLLPYSSAQISWGAKRRGSPCAASLPPATDGDDWRDWANLSDGPAGLIAERVLANDVADYVRFRAVCRPWRRCSADPRAHGALDRRFHPTRWITMLREKHSTPHRRRLLNVSTGQCIQVDVPELRDHHLVLRSSTEGLLVLRHELTGAIRVLNPLTRQVANLPPIPENLFDFSTLDNVGLADDHTVVLYFCRFFTLAFARPGDEHWLLVKIKDTLLATMSFGGRFYGIGDDGLMMVETRESLPPRLVEVAQLAKPLYRLKDSVHLVDNDGELVMVNQNVHLPKRGCLRSNYTVYRVDLDAGKMTRVHGLGGRAVFIGRYCALSVSPQVFPFISANTIYPGFNGNLTSDHKRMSGYHL